MNPNTIRAQVINKWIGDLAVIYAIKNPDDSTLKPILLFYSNTKDPKFKAKEIRSLQSFQDSGFYKSCLFESWDDIPNDVAMAFAW